MADGTYVAINGKFTFEINQNGLDYDNEKERQQAVDDFRDCWDNFLESIKHLDHIPTFEFDEAEVEVNEGE